MGSAKGPKDPGPSAQERALADVAAEELRRSREVFGPLTERMIRNVRATDAERALATGEAAADVAIANRAPRRGFGGGRRIGSGRDIYARFNQNIGRSVASGSAEAGALQAVDDAELAGLRKVAAFGRNLQDDARVGFRRGAARATRRSIRDANRRFTNATNLRDFAGSVAGFGASYLNRDSGSK